MKKIMYIFILSFSILFSCSDPNELTPTEESLTGFWTYEQVSFNGIDISQLTPGFTINNYLHIKEDHSAGKCYMNGEWRVQDKNLTLQWTHQKDALVYNIINVSSNTLTLQIKLRQSEYGLSLPQFDEGEIITITEQFVRAN